MNLRARLAGLALVLFAAASTLTGCSRGGEVKLTALFDDVGDLVKGHSVQMADVRIGQVTGIELTDDFKAKVSMRIRRSAKVPQDVTAYLRTTSLLGEKFIELRPNAPDYHGEGPYLASGAVIRKTAEAPEIEFVAEQAIGVLGAVTGDDVATLVDTGATALRGRAGDLRSLIDSLSSISATLASRTTEIGTIIDNLDRATTTLASGSDDIATLLTRLADTTKVLADNRNRAVTALDQLSRLAKVQNDVLDRYLSDMDRQVKQVDAILAVAAGQTGEVGRLVDWLDVFLANLRKAVPDDMTQVYMWLVPQATDPRTAGGAP